MRKKIGLTVNKGKEDGATMKAEKQKVFKGPKPW
jgi:hypothetical protein